MLKLGSFVPFKAPFMYVESVREAIKTDCNCFMVFTGAPQNNFRKPIHELYIDEALDLMRKNNLKTIDVVVHAPYLINLADTKNYEDYKLSLEMLADDINRCRALGSNKLVLHPGNHLYKGEHLGLSQVIHSLDYINENNDDVIICLETMAGKDTEVGKNFDELAYIFNHVKEPGKLGVCLDTCHIHDAGYDVHDFDLVLDEFDLKIGLDKLLVVHINDSKNIRGSKRDRHEFFGYGKIGFDCLIDIIYNPRIKHIVKILESPYYKIGSKEYSPYLVEIEMIKNKKFVDWRNKQITFDF